MKKSISFIFAGLFTVCLIPAQTLSKQSVGNLPVEFSYLTEEFHIEDQGGGSYMAEAKGGEVYYIMLNKASSRYNADSLRYTFTNLYKEDPSVENIQVNEVGSGKLGNLDGERVRITFMSNGGYYTATALLVRFHLNRKYNSFLLTYEMSERSEANKIRYDAVKKGFEDLASSFVYKEFKYKNYVYTKDSVSMDHPDFWYAGKNDTSMLIDDGRCKVTEIAYLAKDSSTTETYAKCERDAMKKNSALYPAYKGNITRENWRNDELCTKFAGTYEYDEFGNRKTRSFAKYIIRRNVGGKMKDYHVYFECPEMYSAYYTGIFEIMLKSLQLPGIAAEVKK